MRIHPLIRQIVVTLWCAGLASVVGVGAESNSVEAARRTVAASGENFVDFVNVTTSADSLPLKAADQEGGSPEQKKVCETLLARIDAVALRITPAEKAARLREMEALAQLQKWLLRSSDYGNLVVAARIDLAISRMVTAAILDGVMTVDEARVMIGKLDVADRRPAVLAILAPYVGDSKVMKEYQQGIVKVGDGSLFSLAEALARERSEVLEPEPGKILDKARPASFLFLASSGALNRVLGRLIEYLGKGGDCHLEWEAIAADVRQRTPELFEKAEPFSGKKLKAANMFGFLTEMRTLPNPL